MDGSDISGVQASGLFDHVAAVAGEGAGGGVDECLGVVDQQSPRYGAVQGASATHRDPDDDLDGTEGGKLAGTMSWPDQKATKLKDLKLKDGTLTFSAERKFMDNKINVEYKLTIDGDKLKGKGAAEFGGEKREWDIEGKREKGDK